VLVTTLSGGKSGRISYGPCVRRQTTQKLVGNSVVLVQEGPSLSLMACKYTRIKDCAIPVFGSTQVHKLLEKGRSVLQGTHDIREGLVGKAIRVTEGM